MHTSTLIKLGHIQVRSGSDPDYYPGQWVIWVSDADPVSTLMQAHFSVNSHMCVIKTHGSVSAAKKYAKPRNMRGHTSVLFTRPVK